jgi:DNA-binding MarR family transcriptional regulator
VAISNARKAGIASRLHSAAIHLLRWVREVDLKMGLSPARASALSVLVFAGERTIGELAAAEQVTAPTMTRLVAALEADGYVKRTPGSDDKRAVFVRATAKARRVLEAGRRRRVEELERLLGGASEADWTRVERVVELLERTLL